MLGHRPHVQRDRDLGELPRPGAERRAAQKRRIVASVGCLALSLTLLVGFERMTAGWGDSEALFMRRGGGARTTRERLANAGLLGGGGGGGGGRGSGRGGVVPGAFEPTTQLRAVFGTHRVADGDELRPSQLALVPAVTFAGRRGEAYALALLDADDAGDSADAGGGLGLAAAANNGSSSSSQAAAAQAVGAALAARNGVRLHWLAWDIPGATRSAADGLQLVPYEGPEPKRGSGLHRYVLLLYHHVVKPLGATGAAGAVQQAAAPKPPARRGFNATVFAAEHGLAGPIAATFFLAED